MSRSSPRINARSIQVAVRLPLDVHAALLARGPISPQIIELARQATQPHTYDRLRAIVEPVPTGPAE
jgi:hypothetical protein